MKYSERVVQETNRLRKAGIRVGRAEVAEYIAATEGKLPPAEAQKIISDFTARVNLSSDKLDFFQLLDLDMRTREIRELLCPLEPYREPHEPRHACHIESLDDFAKRVKRTLGQLYGMSAAELDALSEYPTDGRLEDCFFWIQHVGQKRAEMKMLALIVAGEYSDSRYTPQSAARQLERMKLDSWDRGKESRHEYEA